MTGRLGRRVRPIAWTALVVSVFVAGALWYGITQPTPQFYGAMFGDDWGLGVFVSLVLLFVGAILDIAAMWRGAVNRVIAAIALIVLLSPLSIYIYGSYLS